MVEAVFDASAVLAIAFNEPGAEHALARMSSATISTVNLSEAGAKLIDKGLGAVEAFRWLAALQLKVEVFDGDQAVAAASLRAVTRTKRLSFADRACIALAASKGAVAMTTDRAWAELDLPCPIKLLR